MFPDDSPISGLDGFAGEMYRDIKTAGKWFIGGVAKPFKHHRDYRDALAAFSRDLPSHGTEVTRLVDYAKWHESDKDWHDGNGFLATATYGELPHLWTRVERFSRYEARLLRFIRAGGEVRRIFVIHADLDSEAGRLSLCRSLWRHKELNFNPHIVGINDLDDAADAIGIRADAIGCFNGKIVYGIQCHDDRDPTMMRTIEPVTVFKVAKTLANLWRQSSSFKDFSLRHNITLSKEMKDQVQRDIETVEELAYRSSDI